MAKIARGAAKGVVKTANTGYKRKEQQQLGPLKYGAKDARRVVTNKAGDTSNRRRAGESRLTHAAKGAKTYMKASASIEASRRPKKK